MATITTEPSNNGPMDPVYQEENFFDAASPSAQNFFVPNLVLHLLT